MDKQVEWQTNTTKIWDNGYSIPISIGPSISIAQVEFSGMIEFRPNTNTFSTIVNFPEAFFGSQDRDFHRILVRRCHDDRIVCINHTRGWVLFDTQTLKFSDVVMFHYRNANLRGGFDCISACVTIGNHLHIMRDTYTIHSFIDGTEQQFEDPRQAIEDTCALIKPNDVYQSSNKTLIVGFARNETPLCIPEVIAEIISEYSTFELFRFGGSGRSAATQCVSFDDSFYIGTLKDEDPAQPIKWKLAPQYKLKHPMIRFGYIQYGSFIVTFGGLIQDGRFKLSNSIYILNLHGNCGWIESPIKVPKNQRLDKSVNQGYWLRAVLDESKLVHLNGIYSIDLMDILPLGGL